MAGIMASDMGPIFTSFKPYAIKSINGYTLDTIEFAEFSTLLRLKPGKKITVKYIRNNESYKTTFKLERHI